MFEKLLYLRNQLLDHASDSFTSSLFILLDNMLDAADRTIHGRYGDVDIQLTFGQLIFTSVETGEVLLAFDITR